MESKQLLLAITIVAVVLTPGCNSQRPRLAWWKPTSMWSSKDKAETSALARSAPDLPSSKFEPMEPSSTAVAANTRPTTPDASRDALASAPTAKYPSAASTDYVSPASKTTDATPTAITALANTLPDTSATQASTMAPQSSPYSNENYTPAASASGAVAGTTSADQPHDRYAPVDRYATPPVAATSPLGSSPAFSPLAATTPADNSLAMTPEVTSTPMTSIDPTASVGGGRYDRYNDAGVASATPSAASIPAAATTGAAALPSTNAATPTAASVAQVALPSTPGYRPGGTSTYTAASTTNIATRPANPESATGYPASRYEDPAQPASPSSYGAPDRYR